MWRCYNCRQNMKIKKICYAVTISLLSLFPNTIKAQFYTNEVLFYSEAGQDIDHSITVIIIYSNGTIRQVESRPTHYVKRMLYNDENYYENLSSPGGWKFDYDSSKSTSSRLVYERKHYIDEYPMYGGVTMYGMAPKRVLHSYMYMAFTPDKSSYIYWEERPNNYDGKILNKRHYTRVPKEYLLPKAVNYDFLYE